MQRRLLRTIVSVTIASAFQVASAGAGETGTTGQAEAPAGSPPSQAAPQPPAASSPPSPAPAQTGAASAPGQGTNPAPSQGTPALVLDTQDYEGLLGKSVRAQNGDDLGRIIDVIIDRDGRPRAAIIDFGGFLGVGSRKIAVDWRVLKFANEGKTGRITLTLNRNQVRVSPEYKTGEPIVVLGASAPGAHPAEGEQAAAHPAGEKAAAAPAADKAQTQGQAPAQAQVPVQPPAPEKAPEKPEKTPDR